MRIGLTEIQYGIYAESLNNEQSTMYNNPIISELEEGIDIDRLAESIVKMQDVHPALKNRFHRDDDGNVYQEAGDTIVPGIFRMSDEEFEQRKKTLIRPFDMDGGVLSRFEIYITPSASYLFMDGHHTIFDGSSCQVMNRCLADIYEGKEPVKEKMSVSDIYEREKKIGEKERASALSFYDELLSDADVDSSPMRDVYSDEPMEKKVEMDFSIDGEKLGRMRKNIGFSTTAFFSAAMGIALTRFSGNDRSLFNTVNNGRNDDDADTVTMLVRTHPFYMDLSDDPSVADLLKRSFESLSGCLSNTAVSFREICNRYSLNSEINFTYQGKFLNVSLIKGHEKNTRILFDSSQIWSTKIVAEVMSLNRDDYRLIVRYRGDWYSDRMIDSVCRSYINIAKGMLVKEKVSEIPSLDDASEALIDSFNDTDTGLTPPSVIGLLEKNMAERPEKDAIAFKDRRVTYGQLDSISSRIASYIMKKGLGRDDFISILMPRSELMTVSAVGVLRSGAAYQPLDPSYPKERLNFMVKDAGAKLVIADKSLIGLLDGYMGDVLFSDEFDSLEDNVAALPTPGNGDAFIILYTSGTTGTPKGCIIEHGNIASYMQWVKRRFDVDDSVRYAAYASFGFDANMLDTYTALCNGGTLYIVPEEIRLDLAELDRFFIDNGITQSLMTTQVGRQFVLFTQCRTLKHFAVGGEKLIPCKPPEWVSLHNLYGPTETTVSVTGYDVTEEEPMMPIGTPNSDTKVYIVGKNGMQLPIGALGEMYIAGPQVGRGYLNRPDKTSQVFIENPFSDDPRYKRAYRTGDVARWLPEGNIEYIGRNDGQVKVRGFRIELTEVEKVIRDFKGIEDATVVAFDSPSGGKNIAAYIVSSEKVDIGALNDYIRSVKPPYMVPAVTMQIDRIPLTVNSKVDRRKLPLPEMTSEGVTPPQNDMQKRIFDIVSGIVGSKGFGIDTELSDAGVDSISMIRLNILLSKEFGVDMQIKDIRDNNSIKALESCISSKKKSSEYDILPDYPLSKTQEGIFAESMAHPGGTAYNIPLLIRISKDLDLDRLKRSIATAIDAHPQLKATIFLNSDGDIRQRRVENPFDVMDIETLTADSIDSIKKDLMQPYDIVNGKLIRIRIIEAGDRYLLIDTHHIISDGTSLGILVNDITRAYLGETVEKERFTGFDASLIEQERRAGPELSAAKAYYEKLLGGCETDNLPRPCVHGSEPDSGAFDATGCDVEDIQEYCAAKGMTLNGYVSSAFGFILSKYCSLDEPVFATVYNGRNDSRLNGTVSMLVKTLPVICRLEGTVEEYIRATSNQLSDSMTNDIYSFAEIAKEYSFKSDVILVYQGDDFKFDSICGKGAELIPLESDEAKSSLTVEVSIENGRMHYACRYDPLMFNEGFISNFIESYDNVMRSLVSSKTLDDVAIADDRQLSQIDSFNDTDTGDTPPSVISMLERMMSEHNGKDAIAFKDRRVTYGQLDSLSRRIASFIIGKGIGKNEFVSILMPRGEMMTVSAVGVLRSGAAYQPLDPSYPKERLNFMVKDAGARLVIADRSLIGLLDGYSGDVLYSDEIDKLDDSPVTLPAPDPEDAFIILYTSGTTGTPKGCILEHGNLASYLQWVRMRLETDDSTRYAAYASFGFDANMLDTYSTLCNGGTLYIIQEEIRLDLAELDRFFVDNAITHTMMTTQVGRQFVLFTKCRTLKHIVVGGEKLVPCKPPEWMSLHNMYGPTETTASVTEYRVTDEEPLMPIGVPNSNMKMYIVGKNGKQMPVGALGEMYIAGPQVGRGYLNRPDKTPFVFIENPFSDDPKYKRAYRTGDVARWLPDGNLEYIGRNDGQVKVRGFRIELTEVEKVIRDFEGINDATVAAFDSPSGGKYLAAYVVSDSKVDKDALCDYIRTVKPPYMVPAAIIQLDRIPLTVNSKVDRRKLPEPTAMERAIGKPPSNELEKKLCGIFANVLGVSTVYADDNFFDIGGTSISATKLLLNCMNNGLPLVYKNIFDNPTPEALSRFIEGPKDNEESLEERAEDARGPLSYNRVKNLNRIGREPLGDVLLVGSTGFLGIHVLAELIKRKEGRILCLIRDSKRQSAEDRLRTMAMYYFGGVIDTSAIDDISIIKGDISDGDLNDRLKGYRFDTIINCAAMVKHFAFDDSIERVNYLGAKNLIEVALDHGCRFVHTSTTSVAGESVNGSVPEGTVLKEDALDIGQNLDNKYVSSKFRAEKAILEAIEERGLKGKIVRVGNLMSRESDGEFQINFNTNSFMKSLKSYRIIGCFPVDDMDIGAEFTPVDAAAEALVSLAGTPDGFTVFHVDNCHRVHMANIIESIRRNGMNIDIVSREEFEGRLKECLSDEKVNSEVSSLLSYMGNDGESRRFIGSDNTFTVKALYRLGFSWPIIDSGYIDRVVKSLETLRFFGSE